MTTDKTKKPKKHSDDTPTAPVIVLPPPESAVEVPVAAASGATVCPVDGVTFAGNICPCCGTQLVAP